MSGEAAIEILREKKKTSGRGSYKPHFDAVLKPNTSPNRFFAGSICFCNRLSACTTMRQKRRKIKRKVRKSKTYVERVKRRQ